MEFDVIRATDPEVAHAMELELQRQRDHLELIASENFISPAVMEAMGSHLTNKYAEGYPGARFYGGCQYVDMVEDLARDRAKKLFGADHANVQPHSGSQANMGVYFAMLNPGDTILGMDLRHGGHLTHGSPASISGKYFKSVFYGVDPKTEAIDYDQVRRVARETKPKIIVVGASAYPRTIDFPAFRAIADEVGAYMMVDIAHIVGLIAAGCHPSPIPYADFVTTTTHKTLRGPRGGMILCKAQYAKKIDSAIFPGIQGGPVMHTIAAKAVCFKEALAPEFKDYQRQIIANAKALADELLARGLRLVSGGTDTHLMLVDLTKLDKTGIDTQVLLDEANITANKNTIPFDTKSPNLASGVRFGTPAVTSRGMKEAEMKRIGEFIARIIYEGKDAVPSVKEQVLDLCDRFPLYPNLQIR